MIWKNKKVNGKTAFETVGTSTGEREGGSSDYSATVEIVNGKNQIEPSFKKFDIVLRTFNLLNEFNP